MKLSNLLSKFINKIYSSCSIPPAPKGIWGFFGQNWPRLRKLDANARTRQPKTTTDATGWPNRDRNGRDAIRQKDAIFRGIFDDF